MNSDAGTRERRLRQGSNRNNAIGSARRASTHVIRRFTPVAPLLSRILHTSAPWVRSPGHESESSEHRSGLGRAKVVDELLRQGMHGGAADDAGRVFSNDVETVGDVDAPGATQGILRYVRRIHDSRVALAKLDLAQDRPDIFFVRDDILQHSLLEGIPELARIRTPVE